MKSFEWFPVSRFEKLFNQAESEFRGLCQEMLSDSELLARFLNTLSFMEYLGAAKIFNSTSYSKCNSKRMEHLAEEFRHAAFFKRFAQSLDASLGDYSYRSVLCQGSSRAYLGRQDAMISRAVQKSEGSLELAYWYVTACIEIRAEWLYSILDSELRKTQFLIPLQPILIEELGHLKEMAVFLQENDPQFETRMNAFLDHENKVFLNWLGALGLEVQKWKSTEKVSTQYSAWSEVNV